MPHMSYKAYFKAKDGKGMSFNDYKSFAQAAPSFAKGKNAGKMFSAEEYAKAADEFDPNDLDKADDEDEDDDDEEPDEAEKGERIDGDALMKAVADYDAVEAALGQSGGSRESYLKARMDAGTISKSEQSELGRLWAGMETAPTTELRKGLTAQIADKDADAAALVDASDFLKSLVSGVDDALGRVESGVTRDGAATRQLLKAQGSLVKSLAHHLIAQDSVIERQGELLKAMGERLQVVESTPAGRRSVGSHDPRDVRSRTLAKAGVAGGDPNALSKSQVQAGLRGLIEKAAQADDDQAIDRIAHETAKYESTGTLSPNMIAAIRQMTVN